MTFAVLCSHASSKVYPDLVCAERNVTAADAEEWARVIRRAQPGILTWIMSDESGVWRDRLGRTFEEIIREVAS